MSNECRMTPEQWTALLDVIDTTGDDWEVESRVNARRLLVEPEQQPTDPDLTTFGAIPRGQRCQALDDDPVIAGKIFRRAYDGLLRHGRNAVEESSGKLWQIGDDEPVRRLAQ